MTENKDILIPVSAVVPTRNRPIPLQATLVSLAKQSKQPAQIVVIDASDTNETEELCRQLVYGLFSSVIYIKATTRGAASQRNEGMSSCNYDFILFMDDDLLFEDQCMERLYHAIIHDVTLGGVNVMITNQKYQPPGRVSRKLYHYLNGAPLESYAGKCLGPVMNLLPEDRDDLPEVVYVDWLNSGCTLYRKETLPNPPFSSFFTGYSMFEDVTISSIVGRSWKLANARTARVYHDSQPGDHKKSIVALSKMELVNRYYVMTKVLKRTGFKNTMKLIVTESYKVLSYFQSMDGLKKIPAVLWGKLGGIVEIIKIPNHVS